MGEIKKVKVSELDELQDPKGKDYWMFGYNTEGGRPKSKKISLDKLTKSIDDTLKSEIANATINFKGYHSTLDALKLAYPQASTKQDFTAWVGSTPCKIYKVFTNGGAWQDTGDIVETPDIELDDYAKKNNQAGNQVVYAKDGSIPMEEHKEGTFQVEDQAGNVAFKISPDGESSFSNLKLPRNVMQMIESKVNESMDGALEQINKMSSAGISGDIDAVIYGLSKDTSAKNNLCFIHLSDTHSYQPAFDKMVETANKYSGIMDAVIHSGDIVERYSTYPSTEATINYMNSLGCPVPIYLTMGNHDKEGTAAKPYLTKEEQYNQFIKPNLSKWGASTQENKCYYYKDFANYGIRYISLDIIDFSDAATAPAGQDSLVTSQAQIDWFINTLKDAATKGISVIVGVHYPMTTDNVIVVNKIGFYNYSETLILDIVDAFIKGIALKKTYKSGNSLFPSINVDTIFDKAGDFITYLSGHVHRDGRGFIRAKQHLKLASAAGDRHHFDSLVRRKGTLTEHLMDIVIINKKVRKIYTFRVGAAMSSGWSDDRRNYSFSEISY